MLVRQHAAQHVLRPVRILVLVDMNIFEFVLIKIEHLRLFLEQLDRGHDEIVEIKRVVALEPLLVFRIDLRHHALKVVANVLLEPLRREQLVLRAADGGLDGTGLEFLVSRFKSFMQPRMTESWSVESRMVKFDVKPMRSISRRRMRTHMEWNVDTQMSRPSAPTSFATRSCISRAALFVNVIARMAQGGALRCEMR